MLGAQLQQPSWGTAQAGQRLIAHVALVGVAGQPMPEISQRLLKGHCMSEWLISAWTEHSTKYAMFSHMIHLYKACNASPGLLPQRTYPPGMTNLVKQ